MNTPAARFTLAAAALLLVPWAGTTAHAEAGRWTFGAGYAPIVDASGQAVAIVGVGLDIAGVPCFLSIEAALAVG